MLLCTFVYKQMLPGGRHGYGSCAAPAGSRGPGESRRHKQALCECHCGDPKTCSQVKGMAWKIPIPRTKSTLFIPTGTAPTWFVVSSFLVLWHNEIDYVLLFGRSTKTKPRQPNSAAFYCRGLIEAVTLPWWQLQVAVSKKEASDLTYGPQGGRGRAPRARHRLGRPAPCCVCVLAGESWCFGSTVTHSLCPKCGCRGQGRALWVAPNPSTAGLVPVAPLTPGAVWAFPPRFVGTRHPWERGGNVVGT